jgi:small subunit ribosomal protein S17
MAAAETQKNTETTAKTGKRLSGVAVSNKMKDTVVVAVSRYVKHPKYQKFVKRVKKFHVHDEGNTVQIGEKVTIRETRPISKTKHFIVEKQK